MKKRYKFLKLIDGKIKSDSGDCTWKIGEWKHEDDIKLCNSGFHCSPKIYHAFLYVQGEILAEVEVKGSSSKEDDKEVYTDMKILRAWKWQKKDSVALSIYAAELCLKNFEKLYPDDMRPREAIEAAKKWLLNPTKENKSAAWSALSAALSAARIAARIAARSAASAALSAAWSALSAALSAESAALSAAWSALSAALSAESAARRKIITKICKWFDTHLPNLEPYEQN